MNEPPAGCREVCPDMASKAGMACGANCPPETNDMEICVAAGITVVDQLLVYDIEDDIIAFTQEAVYGPLRVR